MRLVFRRYYWAEPNPRLMCSLFIVLLLSVLAAIWVLGAAITLKADAVLCREPTDYLLLPIVILCWVPVAILMLRDQHDCDGTQEF